MAFDPEPVRIRGTLEAALALMKDQAVRQGLTLTLDAPENLLARADERLLKQILINLLSNAVKFTPAGGRIDVKAEPCGLDIRVSITDSGIGIRPEDQGRIFLEFEQVEAGHDRSRQGSGLGLPLVKCHVELHGGRVWVESGGEGKGSTFRFTLPAEMAGV